MAKSNVFSTYRFAPEYMPCHHMTRQVLEVLEFNPSTAAELKITRGLNNPLPDLYSRGLIQLVKVPGDPRQYQLPRRYTITPRGVLWLELYNV